MSQAKCHRELIHRLLAQNPIQKLYIPEGEPVKGNFCEML